MKYAILMHRITRELFSYYATFISLENAASPFINSRAKMPLGMIDTFARQDQRVTAANCLLIPRTPATGAPDVTICSE
jgi:hypothetical protein